MAFPPSNKKSAPPRDNEAAEPAPDNEMMEGEAPGGVCPTCGMPMGGSPGMGAMPGMAPSMGKPGQGMDPMEAMLQGIGPQQAPQNPLGPNGLPIGGRLPHGQNELGQMTPPDMGGSAILSMLASGASDPYSQPAGIPAAGLAGIGDQDPEMGLEQILQMLALAKLGAAGNPQTSSGLPAVQGNPIDSAAASLGLGF